MLVLSRREEQGIVIGGTVKVRVLSIRGDKVTLGIDAPPDVPVHRREVQEQIEAVRRSQELETAASAAEEERR